MKKIQFGEGRYTRVDLESVGKTQVIEVDFFREEADKLTHVGHSRILQGRVCPQSDTYPSEVFALGDIYEIQEELDAYLTEHPGWVTWVDSFIRQTPRAPQEAPGVLTQQLGETLAQLKQEGIIKGPILLFPCSYGEGYDAQHVEGLGKMYERLLHAKQINGTRLLKID